VDKFLAWLVGTFGFASLPMLFQWIHSSNASHSYNMASLLGSAEGWLFCLIVSTAVFLEETQDDTRRLGDSIVLTLSILIAAAVTFEYSDMVYTFKTPVTTDPYWIASEGYSIMTVMIFALLIRGTKHWRPKLMKHVS